MPAARAADMTNSYWANAVMQINFFRESPTRASTHASSERNPQRRQRIYASLKSLPL